MQNKISDIDFCSPESTKNKFVSWLMLEESIASKFQSIEAWKNDWAVKFNIKVEDYDFLARSTKSSDFFDPTLWFNAGTSESPISSSTKSDEFSIPCENEEKLEEKTDALTIKQKSIQLYTEIINDWIINFANRVITSKQNIELMKSLQSIVTNILKNIWSKKKTPLEIKETINKDNKMTNKVIIMMIQLKIIEVSENKENIQVIKEQIEKIGKEDFDFENFKIEIKSRIE